MKVTAFVYATNPAGLENELARRLVFAVSLPPPVYSDWSSISASFLWLSLQPEHFVGTDQPLGLQNLHNF